MTQPPIIPGRQPAWPPPPAPTTPRQRTHPLAWAAAIIIGGSVGAAGFFAYRAFAPAGFPGKPADSGIEACEAMRDGPIGNQTPLTEDRYRKTRALFAGSRDPDIRENGTKLIDIAWQAGQDESKALAYMGPLMDAASGLQTACADHGIILPNN